jgi:hypothetical protein
MIRGPWIEGELDDGSGEYRPVVAREVGGHGSGQIEVAGCAWFALCDQEATTLVGHPVLGQVPTCPRCAARVEATA